MWRITRVTLEEPHHRRGHGAWVHDLEQVGGQVDDRSFPARGDQGPMYVVEAGQRGSWWTTDSVGASTERRL
jgi:hypothetical protein